MEAIDFKAAQKWRSIPRDIQVEIINNVFCSTCEVTTIINYTLEDNKFGVLLKGKCDKCGKDVARLVESD